MEVTLTVWVIYRHPSDYPDKFVLRPQMVVRGIGEPVKSHQCWTADTLGQVRRFLPPGLTCLGRCPEDAPPIVETWI